MILWHIALLAIVQGITEPLPISSSGHLALFHHILGSDLTHEAASARLVDIAVHFGTFLALFIYFWRDNLNFAKAGLGMLQGRFDTPDARMAQFLVVASIPAVIGGYFVSQLDPSVFYSLERLAWALIVFGILLGVADHYFKRVKDLSDMTFGKAFLIGCAQVLAFLPGVSRSGVTMTAGRFLGFDRVSVAKFSFLMAMIATFGAGIIGTMDVIHAGENGQALQFIVAIGLSFLTTLAAVHFLLHFLTKFSFMPFVIYRVILGIGILAAVHYGLLA